MRLLTQEIKKKLPPIRGQEQLGEDAVIYCKFFTPDSSWTWYVTEGSPVKDDDGKEIDFEFYGLVDGHCQEYGYFVLSELEKTTGPMGLHIERDKWWKPMTIREIRRSIDGLPPEPDSLDPGEPLVYEPAEPTESEMIEAIREITDRIKERDAEIVAECGEKVMLRVSKTTKDTTKYGKFLVPVRCDCEKSKFLCYPEDGACICGIYKHHVHCAKCGGVSQVG